MNFSDVIPSSICAFSHSGRNLAACKGQELFIYKTDNLQVEYKYAFPDLVTSIEWSPDDNLIMAIIAKKN